MFSHSVNTNYYSLAKDEMQVHVIFDNFKFIFLVAVIHNSHINFLLKTFCRRLGDRVRAISVSPGLFSFAFPEFQTKI